MSFGAEDAIHVAVLEWVKTVRPDAIVWHIPNGGHRTLGVARKMQRLGVKPGVADLEVVIAGYPTIYFEVKAPKGRLSPDQIQFGSDMLAAGRYWSVVRSIDEARAVFKTLGVETRESTAFVAGGDL